MWKYSFWICAAALVGLIVFTAIADIIDRRKRKKAGIGGQRLEDLPPKTQRALWKSVYGCGPNDGPKILIIRPDDTKK